MIERELRFRHSQVLRDAVTERWLASISGPLEAVANEKRPARVRPAALARPPRRVEAGTALADPELFATYIELTADARDVVKAHVDSLLVQLARIITDGVEEGAAFETAGPQAAARAVFDATARFHNPVHAAEWSDPGIEAAYKGVRSLVLEGLARERSRGASRVPREPLRDSGLARPEAD